MTQYGAALKVLLLYFFLFEKLFSYIFFFFLKRREIILKNARISKFIAISIRSYQEQLEQKKTEFSLYEMFFYFEI